jgi:hypothetical protein
MVSGQPNPSSLPIQVDASGAATYTMGDAVPQLDGVVEISFDDPNFATPRLATLGEAVNDNHWQLQLSGSELVVGPHTAYVRQRINGHNPSPVVSVSYTIFATVEQSVNSLATLGTTNVSFVSGIMSFDLTVQNTSTQTIYAPMRVEVVSITSASGTVRAINADNGMSGAGALWDYSNRLGADGVLSPGEISGTRHMRFSDPQAEMFTVTFNVIGNLPR